MGLVAVAIGFLVGPPVVLGVAMELHHRTSCPAETKQHLLHFDDLPMVTLEMKGQNKEYKIIIIILGKKLSQKLAEKANWWVSSNILFAT